MEKITNATVYKCEHCNRISFNAGAMKQHECACNKNPNNVPMCDDCYWLDSSGYNTQYLEVVFSEGTEAERFKSYNLEVQYCPYYGKLYHKLYGLVAEYVEADGWMKKPSKVQGCCHFLSFDTACKIRSWGNNKYDYKLDWFEDFKVTPQAAFEYFTEIGDTENAKRFEPHEYDNA